MRYEVVACAALSISGYLLKGKTMKNAMNAFDTQLASMQIELLQKLQSGQVTPRHLRVFLDIAKEHRDVLVLIHDAGSIAQETSTPIVSPPTPVVHTIQTLVGADRTVTPCDQKSVAIGEFDPTKVVLYSPFQDGEDFIECEEFHRRVCSLSNMRPLGAQNFLHLWNNQHLIPEEWKKGCISFCGDIVLSSYGTRCQHVMDLFWSIDFSRWDWEDRNFDTTVSREHVAAVLKD